MVAAQVHFPVDQWGLTLVREQVFALDVGLRWFSGKALESLVEGFLSVCWFQGCPRVYVTSSGPSASACALQDSGELCSSTERDSSFPHSTPGVVPLVPTCIQKSISSSQPVYGQAGGYEKYKRQYLTHNV